MRLLLVWVLFALAPFPLVLAQDEPVAQEPSALDSIEALVQGLAEPGAYRGFPARQFDGLIGPAVAEAETSPQAHRRLVELLIVLATVGQDSLADPPEFGRVYRVGGRGAVRSRAAEELGEVLGGPLGGRCALQLAEVLVDAGRPLAWRQFCSWLCAERRVTAGRQALMTVARSPADPLRPRALYQLAGWPDPAVDLFLVRLAGRAIEPGARPHPVNVLLSRIGQREWPLAPRAATELAIRLGDMLLSRDWRKAARAVVLSQGLDPSRRVPLLIAGLEAWRNRAARGRGSARIEDDLASALRGISGLNIGANPARWKTWWSAVEAGTAPLRVERDAQRPRSSAGFFGLRAASDRVTFVLDISGSMEARWRTSEHSRYVEAIDQMMNYLQAMGEDAHFNVILFSSDHIVSSTKLVRATARNLQRARDSLLARQPNGGTNLRPAVEAALCLDRAGEIDLERLEADTIVVLCDGDTTSGAGWVAPLLERVQVDAQVRIHCVLIGARGDGTLQALAKATGGDFVRIN